MTKRLNLLEGNISSVLFKVAMPIMATSLIQMAYSFIDMIWIGRIGEDAVTAIGTASMYFWIAEGLAMISRIGGQVNAANNIGAGNMDKARSYVVSTLQLSFFISLVYSICTFCFSNQLIGFFNLNSAHIVRDAEAYLKILSPAFVVYFFAFTVTGLITATGDSKTPFKANSIGLIINILLDPILIFGLGPLPRLGVEGAAFATAFSELIVAIVLLIHIARDKHLFLKINVFRKINIGEMKKIIYVGFPTAIQNLAFAFIAMIISRLVVVFGDEAVAVQRVGAQIESLSWMTSDGFSSAVNTFVAQNYGAKNIKRAKEGHHTALKIMTPWGIFVSLILFFGAVPIFQIFIPNPELAELGANYLRILALSQLFSCYEIVTQGAFAGFGRTIVPSTIGISLNIARIPIAILLSSTVLGLNGIWWAITISSVMKGLLLVILFRVFEKKI